MSPRKNRITVEIYAAQDAEAQSSHGAHWVEIKGAGGCELTLWATSREHALQIAYAINKPSAERPAVIALPESGIDRLNGMDTNYMHDMPGDAI